MPKRRQEYIEFTLIRLSALIHCVLGSIVLILSGVVLFALPAIVFYATFILGFYLFLPGIVITFGLVNRRTARSWARYMIPLWKWLP
ncbi:MAG TPA: hypothetical protein VFK11_01225 [Candidatus Saccharimonadales bacterium]|nr:hypothetical protein [Candidatus Saccharimonadales bacterium]